MDFADPLSNEFVSFAQLTQIRVPLEDAAMAFTTRDENGKLPIILIPTQAFRIRNELVIMALSLLVGGVVLGILLRQPSLITLAFLIGPILLILGIYRAFLVRIPEGAKALLTRGGRFVRTVEPGLHILPPWIIVSHLVTQREIPFDVPVVEAPTSDDVRANIDTLFTFHIYDPYQFVFNISANDFDQVLQAVCQDTLRAFTRTITSHQVMDLRDANINHILESLNMDMATYGVKVMKIKVTFAQPPIEFMRSQEMRQLAILQQAEQQEAQALAIRRQKDEDALSFQRILAQVEREKEILRITLQKAEMRRLVEEMEAETEEFRLARKERRINKYPQAWAWERELARLEVARSLAGNTRAMLQLGDANDITRAFLVRDILQDTPVSPAGETGENEEDVQP
ncbi:MAG: SPFH domain-containing protein [Ardenticatenaceae bacterium]|nr:SPFH domain-containing protein [Anaerolineales bacterium]MCB8919767.1 SPFH domain-containing protein [Ardenticatenaceae bacterium]